MAEASDADFRGLLDTVNARLDEITHSSSLLFERGNRALALLPAAMTGDLRDTLTAVRDLVAKLLTKTAEMLANPGWPPGLSATAHTWNQTIGAPISALSGQLGTDQLRIDNYWQGPAADAYASTLPAQQNALDAVKQATDALADALNKISWGIWMLWAGIGAALLAFTLELGVETGAAATVIGAPPAAAAAGVSVAKAATLISALTIGFLTYLTSVNDAMTVLQQAVTANSTYPHERWPRSTTADFSDGTLADGDTTDWRITTHD